MLRNIFRSKRYKKRTCPIKMRLVPYGAGWTDVYADFGGGELYFVISDIMCESFELLMKALYNSSVKNSITSPLFSRFSEYKSEFVGSSVPGEYL